MVAGFSRKPPIATTRMASPGPFGIYRSSSVEYTARRGLVGSVVLATAN